MRPLTHYERSLMVSPRDEELAKKFVDAALKDMALDEVPFALWATEMAHSACSGHTDPTGQAARFSAVLREVVGRMLKSLPDSYSYNLLCRDPSYARLYSRLMSLGKRKEVEPSMMAEYFQRCFVHAGKCSYEVSPELADRLSHTELRGLTSDDLRLPYDAVYIVVPATADLKVWNDDSGWHRVDGIYIVEDRCMREDEGTGEDKGEPYRGWRLMVCGEPKGLMEYGGIMLQNDALSYFSVPLPAGKSLDQCIKLTLKAMKRHFESGESTWNEKMGEEWTRQFQWAMNCVLYVTWGEPAEHWEANPEARKLWERIQKTPEGTKTRQNLERKLASIRSQPRLRLGWKIPVRRHGVETLTNEATKAFDPARPGVRTRVAGHWKRQVCGPGRTDRKLIHVEWYWRNLDGTIPDNQPIHEVR